MLFTSPLVMPSRVYSFIKGMYTYKNWNLFTEGKMQVLKKYYFGRLNFLPSIYIFPCLDLPLSLKNRVCLFQWCIVNLCLGSCIKLGVQFEKEFILLALVIKIAGRLHFSGRLLDWLVIPFSSKRLVYVYNQGFFPASSFLCHWNPCLPFSVVYC